MFVQVFHKFFQRIFFIFLFYIFMQTGKVKFFNESKGFGFIVDDNSGEEIFVHVTGLSGITIRENDLVSFEVQEGKRGLNAINVKKA
jgi:cold shock protein